MFDAEKCEALLNALSNYHKEYDERAKLFRDAPAHEWSSHCADTWRYLAVGWETPFDADTYKPPPPSELYFNPFTYRQR